MPVFVLSELTNKMYIFLYFVISLIFQETHALRETDDPCCPECVPIMSPCGYKATRIETLTVTSETSSNCTSKVEMGVSVWPERICNDCVSIDDPDGVSDYDGACD